MQTTDLKQGWWAKQTVSGRAILIAALFAASLVPAWLWSVQPRMTPDVFAQIQPGDTYQTVANRAGHGTLTAQIDMTNHVTVYAWDCNDAKAVVWFTDGHETNKAQIGVC